MSSRPNMKDNIRSSTEEYQLCCCCLELVCLKSLWTEYMWMGRPEVYGDMLKECFNLLWPQTDKSKEQICEVCITQLRNAVHFKQKVILCQATITSQVIDVTRSLKEEKLKTETKVCTSNDEVLTTIEIVVKNNEQTGDQFNDDDDDLKMGDGIKTPLIKSEKLHEGESDVLERVSLKDPPDRKTVTKITGTRKRERRKLFAPKKREIIDRRQINYINPRQNICIILEHSTILPFKSNKGYFNCFYCNKQFAGFNELKPHVSEAHENITFKTILKSIRRPRDRIRADVSDINCRICNKKIENLDFLIKHLTEEHSAKFIFEDTIKPADCILPYYLSDGKYKCYQCKEEFLFFKTLSKHMNDHSTDHVCDVCGRCFLLPERLRAHTQVHKVTKSVKCEVCGKICGSKLLLKSHIRYTHKKISFMCSICNKIFPTCRSRMLHLEEVHNRAPLNLTCKICSKKFRAPNSLNSHMSAEHINLPREPKHGCDICGMMFKSRNALNYHLVVHSSEKNYECEICHKKYARAKTLTEHLKIHMNVRRWSCRGCLQAFVQKCSLKNHIRVHHVGMDYEQLIVDKKLNEK